MESMKTGREQRMDFKRRFSKLFEPGKIGIMELKNRIVMSPMGTHLPEDEKVTQSLISYLSARARGGAGLIITEAARIQPRMKDRLGLYDDKFIPGLLKLTEAIHAGGAKAAVQILPHRGREDEKEPVGPSDVALAPSATAKLIGIPERLIGLKPRVLSIDEIEELIEEFGKAAKRARLAGFDAIEVHGAHGTLITDFLSPLANKRADMYGGSIEGRARLAVEMIKSAKVIAGKDFPVIFRLSADEYVEGGFTLKDAIPVSKILENAGADAIDVSAGTHLYSLERMIQPMSVPRGCNVPLAREIKKAVHIPVMVVGRINDPYLAEEILEQGKADFIDLGRALIADPEFPLKVKKGRVEDICPCIACLNCMHRIPPDKISIASVGCTVNPMAGREVELKIESTKKAKNVLVVGGGPAGMEAAMIASQRGHIVTLCEKDARLGGQLLLACVPPHKEEISSLTRYLSKQVEKSRIYIRVNTKVTLEVIKEAKPNVVIIATGASSLIPDIPGVRAINVVTALEVLSGTKEIGNRVIIIGGGMVGCETAEFLAGKGKKVIVLEMLESVGQDIVPPFLLKLTIQQLKEAGVKVETGTKALEITSKGVKCARDGKLLLFSGDTIVLAVGMKSNDTLANEIKGKVATIYSIGDCVKPQRIVQAIKSGFDVAREL